MKKSKGEVKKRANSVLAAALSVGILMSQVTANAMAMEPELLEEITDLGENENSSEGHEVIPEEALPEETIQQEQDSEKEQSPEDSAFQDIEEDSEISIDGSKDSKEMSDTGKISTSRTYDGTLSETGGTISNEYFTVAVGEHGQISSLKLAGDEFDTNYVMNEQNASRQNTSGHQWVGELMLATKKEGDSSYTEERTSNSAAIRSIYVDDENDKITVVYDPSAAEAADTPAQTTDAKQIRDLLIVETYELKGDHLSWDISLENVSGEPVTVGDLGLPLPFNEFWTAGDQIYETRAVDHSFVGQNGSYIYVTRPSGQGRFLLMTPDQTTDAGFEYQDHWRTSERESYEAAWCQDQSGWQNGLNVFYIHSDYIKKTGRGYLENTSLSLDAGQKHDYIFNFTAVADDKDLGSKLYEEGLMDAVAVPGMTFARNMPAKMYLHTKASKDDLSIEVKCPDELNLHDDKKNTVSSTLPHQGDASFTYEKTVELDGEQYHVYDLKFYDLGQHNVEVTWQGKKTTFQFYIMDDIDKALDTHSTFMVEKTQLDLPGQTGDKVFDDWMMDQKTTRNNVENDYFNMSYWGWGDDWGLTHGTFLAEKNVYQPKAEEVKALDEYLDVAIWNGLMQEHQGDYLIHDFLMNEPNSSPTYRGYAYPHIYNTYFEMYKIASKYPDLIDYKESADTYLLRAYNILNALYNGQGVAYNWGTGVMGESTTPVIIEALRAEGHEAEAKNVESIMDEKYDSFKSQKYPYGSEYSYDNTGEEAVYVLAKMQLENNKDTANAARMLSAINDKTRACRGTQPIWYEYSVPVTNCGENWWQFQYSMSLIGFCMDDYIRYQANGYNQDEKALAQRLSYAAKLGNLTCINSGQIDADSENIGAAAWTYQAEMGNLGGQGTGGGKLHNGWRQMTGEADLGLFGAVQILSSDVADDPVFGLFGYGCEVNKTGGNYEITPLDGLYTKLNLINEELYIELERDQYTRATVSENKDALVLTMKNLEKTPHTSDVTVYGLAEGNYVLSVEGKAQCGFTVSDSAKEVVIPVSLSGAELEKVEIALGSFEGEVVVNAGEDKEVDLFDEFKLAGTITNTADAAAKATGTWTLTNAEDGAEATIETPNNLSTYVTFTKTGVYTFTLTASTGESDEVVITVTDTKVLPEIIADYTFDNIDGKKLLNEVEGGLSSDLVGSIRTGTGKDDSTALVINGKNSNGYVRLNPDLTMRLAKATIAADVKLEAAQAAGAAVFSFDGKGSDKVAVTFENGNQLVLKLDGKKYETGVSIANGYWKNIALSLDGEKVGLYIDGVKKFETSSTAKLSDFTSSKAYYIGRNTNQTDAFFNGSIDNFKLFSVALDETKAKELFGTQEEVVVEKILSADVVTTVGKAPKLPSKVQVLYSNGLYELSEVTWDEIDAESYAKAGIFTVNGTVGDTGLTATVTVMVVNGSLVNLAENATPTAIYENRNDLGGCPTMNDGYEPSSSRDTSHGTWHNWGGNNAAEAWVQYTWSEEQIITASDAYYFRDGNGNFNPSGVNYFYLAEDGKTWMNFTGVTGLGVELDKYNTTTFDPVKTKAIRMIMNPKNLGCGVIEWKVYGYGDALSAAKQQLKTDIKAYSKVKKTFVKEGYEALTEAITAAQTLLEDESATDEALLTADSKMADAFKELKIKDDNWAYVAELSASFTSGWESLPSVNDGNLPISSDSSKYGHWGTWGNSSASEHLTYLWPTPIDITLSSIYLWYDGSEIHNGGIKFPENIEYQILDEEGKWVSLTTLTADDLTIHGFTQTDFENVKTSGLRAIFKKIEVSHEGVGVHEWQVGGARTQARGTLTKKYGSYYLIRDGKAVTGLKLVGDGFRYFKAPKGTMVVNDFATIDGDKYYFDKNGYMVTGLLTKWGTTYYFDKDGKMVKDALVEHEGYTYYFNANGHMVKGQMVTFEEGKRYFDQKGHMAVSCTITRWGKKYIFDSQGILIK